MGSIEKFPKMLELLKKERYSPTMLARKLEADKRTVDKMIKAGMKMNIIGCKSIKISGRKYTVCGLSDDYRRIRYKKRRR